jgi:uncharacterized protein (DUF2235 family)
MGRTIVICCDGTGNTFDKRVTNVSQLIRLLELGDPGRQVAVYAQGVGTNGSLQTEMEAHRASLADPTALRVVPPPAQHRFAPLTAVAKTRGLLFGYGLRETVKGVYRQLSDLYKGPGDSVVLLGFSRGAFAVRALAALLYRCGLPPDAGKGFDDRFSYGWELLAEMRPRTAEAAAFRAAQRSCAIDFLGVFDTVKSYGGLNPVALPHLRHNPVVRTVRHALSLDERRAWYKATTWGQLDGDRHRAMTRLRPIDRHAYLDQDIVEVWFTGDHSDVGGGVISRRWMLAEAVRAVPGLVINAAGTELLGSKDPAPGTPSSKWHLGWWLMEQIPRREIFNDGVWPVKRTRRGSDGERRPGPLQRNREVLFHETADIPSGVEGNRRVGTETGR